MTKEPTKKGGVSGRRDRLPRVILIAGLALGLGIFLVWAFLPIPFLLNWIPDDSFYYFQPAAMMAQGYVPSFDGVDAGNGFHPVWMLLLVPIFALKPVDADLPVHLALALSAVLFTAGAYLIYKILRRLEVDALFAAYGAATFILWPAAGPMAVDGEVTPVNILVLGFLAWTFLRLWEAKRVSAREAVGLGALGGLAILTRNDNALLLAILFPLLATTGAARNRGRAALIAAATAGAVIVPWLAWNYVLTGEVVPTSLGAVPLVMYGNFTTAPGDYGAALARGLRFLAEYSPNFEQYSPLKMGILVVYGVVASWLWHGDRAEKRRVLFLLSWLAFIAACYVVHAGVRWYLRTWHLGAALLVNQLFLWYGLHLVAHKARRPRRFAHVAAAAIALTFPFHAVFILHTPFYPWQREMRAGGDWARAHPRERVGALNAGIVAYYGGNNVVDLDGNMNAAAYEALRRHRLYDYCRSRGVTRVVDYESWAKGTYKTFWPRARVDRLEPLSYELDDPAVGFAHSRYVIFRLR